MTGTLLLAIGLAGYVVFAIFALRAEYHASRSARRSLLLGIPFAIAAGLIVQEFFSPHAREEMRLVMGLVLVLMLLLGVLIGVTVGFGHTPRRVPGDRANHGSEGD